MNRYIRSLTPQELAVLGSVISMVEIELDAWFAMASSRARRRGRKALPEDGDVWWLQGLLILHLLWVVADLVNRAMRDLDSDKLPESWSNVFEGRRVPRRFRILRSSLEHFAEMRWDKLKTEELVEKKRAILDVYESAEVLFGRAFPCILSGTGTADTLDEACAVFECSRQLDHIISHMERDILELDDA